MNGKSVVVIHPFQQHSFKTATAVKEAGMLNKYITTVYDKKGSWTRRLQFLLSSENKIRSQNRKTKDLLDEEVIQLCELRSLFLLVLQRIDKSRVLYSWFFKYLIRRFNAKVYKYLIRTNPDAVIVYDTLCADLVAKIKSSNLDIKIIIDMSAPYYNYMEREFIKDIDKHPDYSQELRTMIDSPLYSYRRQYSKTEVETADAFLVASAFTEKSLVESGIDQQIFLCQYGIDDFTDMHSRSEEKRKNTQVPVKAVFVGRVNQAKGAYLLIEVAKMLMDKPIQFDFFGSYNPGSETIKKSPANCHFHGHVPRQLMIKAYQDSDVLILPTLADGFGFVIPEALSNGLPVIVSSNAGAAQIVVEGVNGMIFNTGDETQLKNLLEKIISYPALIDSMKLNARSSINSLTWEKYNEQVRKALNDIVL